ncbi:MAG: dipeptidase [Planctomycetes bacterium]|nr:dipeptidase [Planctomycetota bacterium]
MSGGPNGGREDARETHRRVIVADMHAHPLLPMSFAGRDPARRGRPPVLWNPLRQHWDLPRALEGGVDIQVWTIYVPVRPVRRLPPIEETFRQIRLFERFVARNSDQVAAARTVGEARGIVEGGRMAFLLAIEGAHALGGSIGSLEELARLGLTYVTLVHFVPNGVCDSSDVPWRGAAPLTDLGKRLIREMDRLGILVDTAHTSDDAFREIARVARGPLVCTHTGCRALCPIRRNIPDDAIREVAATGGIVGIIAFPWYLSRRGVVVGIDRMVDHVAHIAQLVGVDHVGIGTDFDGMIWTVQGLRDVSELPNLTAALLSRGFSGEEVERILGGNFLRVLENVESRRRELACA